MCYPDNRKLCNDQNCAVCEEFSFASVVNSKYLYPYNETISRQITKGSNLKYDFLCDFGHAFKMSPKNIKNGQFCPYPCCRGKLLCADKECIICTEASFANSGKARLWSDKNAKKPRDVYMKARGTYLFNCDKCGKGIFNGFRKCC